MQTQANRLSRLKWRIAAALLLCLSVVCGLQLLLTYASAAVASAPVVDVRIETPAGTMTDTKVSVDGCTITDSAGVDHVLTGPKAACALVAAAKQQGLTYSFDDFGWGLYLTTVNGVASTPTDFWLYRVNYVSPWVGMADYDLSNGDAMLLSYGPWPDIPLKVSASSADVATGEQFTISSSYYDDTTASFQPVGDVQVHLGGQVLTTDSAGNLTTSLTQPGIYLLYIEKAGYVRSAVVPVNVHCSGVAPALGLSNTGARWASYEDYLAGVLTVDFSIYNAAGGADAVNVQLVAAQNTNGVVALSVPQDLGSINAGNSHAFSVQYQLPQEAMGFKTMLFVTADDTCGNQFAYPRPWAGA